MSIGIIIISLNGLDSSIYRANLMSLKKWDIFLHRAFCCCGTHTKWRALVFNVEQIDGHLLDVNRKLISLRFRLVIIGNRLIQLQITYIRSIIAYHLFLSSSNTFCSTNKRNVDSTYLTNNNGYVCSTSVHDTLSVCPKYTLFDLLDWHLVLSQHFIKALCVRVVCVVRQWHAWITKSCTSRIHSIS